MSIDEVRALLERMNPEQRRQVYQVLRQDYGLVIHPIETQWNTTAELLLEAIHASPDLTQRGVRGILAEATFRTTVVPQQLSRWRSIDFVGDLPYDLLLDDGRGPVKVQVKNQRRERGAVKLDQRLSRVHGSSIYVVETQRTRNGEVQAEDGTKSATRPYRFGEFDVLAVCMQPATGVWTDFLYCPARRLLPRPDAPLLLKVMQPIYGNGVNGWTADFDEAAYAARQLSAPL